MNQQDEIQDEIQRAKFEHWVSGGVKNCPSVERDDKGFYKLMTTYLYWNAWQAAIKAQE